MKLTLFSLCLCLLLALASHAGAHQQPPFSYYLSSAETKTIYLAQVVAVEKDKVTFSVKEVLRGALVAKLVLHPYPSEQNYKIESQWLLAACTPHGWGPDSVGWALKGDCAWIPSIADDKNLSEARKILAQVPAK